MALAASTTQFDETANEPRATTWVQVAASADAPVPPPYEAKHGDWKVQCTACSEGSEEVRSVCWMSPNTGELNVYPGRSDLGEDGYLQWYPPFPENTVEAEGTLTFAAEGASTTTIPADKVFFAGLDGSFFVNRPHYDAIQPAFKKGSSVTISFASTGSGPSGEHKISLKGFTAALQDLRRQGPRYPEKAVCK